MKPVLSIVWAGGKLGAAFYEPDTSQLMLLPDVVDHHPDFELLKLIFAQVDPSVVIVSCRQDERILNIIKSLQISEELLREENRESDSSQISFVTALALSRSNQSIPEQEENNFKLLILAGKDFAPDPCKARLQSQRLPEEPTDRNESDHLMFMTSLIPFANDKMVRAAGALLMFLDKNASSFQIQLLSGRIPVLDIEVWQINDLVSVDYTAWRSLQVFNSELHPSRSTQFRCSKEGLSIYNILNKCRTVQGSKLLRLLLARPTRNIQTLKRRHDVVEYCSSPMNLDFVKTASGCLKSIKNLCGLLMKVSFLHASVTDWRDFYQSVYHCVLLAEVVGRQRGTIELFAEIASAERLSAVKIVVEELMRIIDFNESKNLGRFIPNGHVNAELDTIRKRYASLPKIMSAVASQEIQSLPDYIEQCSVVYLPEVGYLLAVSLWEEGLRVEDMELPGLDYLFAANKVAYYRNEGTREMDAILGDCQVAMLDLETTVMLATTEIVLGEKENLLKLASLAAELDCLMAMAAAANEYNFVRPIILPAGATLMIQDGKHPLLAALASFVPNTTSFEGEERIVLLTGPNASGKSIYLKQVGVIVLMALCGSFVPAGSARIPVYDRISTRINASESVSLGLSTFMIDINQIALAMRTATASSLVLIDEFGKGTADADGLGLLVATVEDFLNRQLNCPTLFLSTHFHSITEHLQVSAVLKLQTMDFVKENNDIIYLYKLKNGICRTSFAQVVARSAGIDEAIIRRSAELQEMLQNPLREEALEREDVSVREETLVSIATEFLNLDIQSNQLDEYLETVAARIGTFRETDIGEACGEDHETIYGSPSVETLTPVDKSYRNNSTEEQDSLLDETSHSLSGSGSINTSLTTEDDFEFDYSRHRSPFTPPHLPFDPQLPETRDKNQFQSSFDSDGIGSRSKYFNQIRSTCTTVDPTSTDGISSDL